MPDIDHLAAVAHFVIDEAGTELGRTKLNKILWFADCASWRRHGRTITGLTEYVKLQYGPVPPRMDLALAKLVESGAIRTDSYLVGTFTRHGFISTRHTDASANHLGPEDKDILREIITAVRPLSAFDVSELSHDALWHETPHGGKISVEAASVKQVTPPDLRVIEWTKRRRP